MHQFNFETNFLHAKKIENVSYRQLANSIGTPFYAYSCAQLKQDIQTLMDTMPKVLNFFYSLK
ncbi:TPA: hypothetical protein ACSP1Y_002560, partial [Aeromonas hydrophila]